MVDVKVSVIVVPRERFSETRRSLESIYRCTRMPFELVYVDGGSPAGVARYLREAARRRGFRLLRRERYLMPNEARNIGAEAASGRLLVFIDNDVVAWPGWLEALVACAEETGAWAVGPVVCIGPPGDDLIHVTRGELHEVEEGGRRRIEDAMIGINERLRDLRPSLARSPCDYVEFHCMLARREALERIGGFDEGMRTTREHIDFCLAVRREGGSIYFEPDACVTHVPPWCGFALSDLPYFLLRWNDDWARESIVHFQRKWGLPDEAQDRLIDWIVPHRRVVFERLLAPFRPRIVRERLGRPLVNGLAATLEAGLLPITRRRGRTGAPSAEGGVRFTRPAGDATAMRPPSAKMETGPDSP
ncbi:glycosyl transferase family 2 [Sulfurifustis variabilis]|uniref:Glycosyl transferase family 2 n=1 Tax=Sulfurifustis variabilis TaxID=1675686 RepID=A0A1B4V3F5_9GAMM|nr:glycosyltransferase [Sulfurifustis variabilis]BAU48088.1 glycosyl transferase family 2 [Sulfurifustis variabilis]